MPDKYAVAFWNLENLFDIENSPRRSEKLQRAIGKDLNGWTAALLNKKISQLASIIIKMNENRGPDVLGVSEVENEYVMKLLVKALAPLHRNYKIVHHDTPDQRGIDVGFIYDKDIFTAEDVFSHAVMRRTATRDILQVNFRTRKNRLLVLAGNHWPSRSGDPEGSAVYRAIAGETLAYFHERIIEVHGAETPVLAMGDFNDEPFDLSLIKYALSTQSLLKVRKARNCLFFNLMWQLLGQSIGTLYFDNNAYMFDQFLSNKNMISEGLPIQVVPTSVGIIRFPAMIDAGALPAPIPFGGMGKPINTNGFSDHFPIAMTIQEA